MLRNKNRDLFAPPSITGSRKVAVFLINFADQNIAISPAQITNVVFANTDSVKNQFAMCSNNKIIIERDVDGNGNDDVFGPFTIPHKSTDGCNYDQWAVYALSEAEKAGVKIDLFQHRVFVFPGTGGCSWGGLAHVGCATVCNMWIPENYALNYEDIWDHEFGHNLGLAHAGSSEGPYYDVSDMMGFGLGTRRCMNAAHTMELAW